MTHYSVRPMGAYFTVHADDTGFNLVGYTNEEMARSKVDKLNHEDMLRSRIATNLMRQGEILNKAEMDSIISAVVSCSIPLAGRYTCNDHSGPVPCRNCVVVSDNPPS